MKRIIAILMVLAIVLCCFAGCGNKDAKEEQQPDVKPVGLANPMVESNAAEIENTFGVTFAEPADAADVKYFITNNEFAEMQFTIAGGSTKCTARLKPSDSFEDISGMYTSWTHEEKDTTYSFFDAELRAYVKEGEDDIFSYLWFDGMGSMMYSLTATASDLNGFDISVMAPEIMGDSFIDYDKDYTGHYEDENYDEIDIIKNADGSYDVAIGIFRLCSLEGTGNNMDGAVEFTVTDPSGGEMNGIFYPNGDNYDLMITVSTWSLLESDTVFEGFALK